MKKKSIRKNQVIIAALAVMIVVAGYLNFKSGATEARESSVLSNAAVGRRRRNCSGRGFAGFDGK